MNAKLCRLTLLFAVFLLGSAACEESTTDSPEPSAGKTPDTSAAPDTSSAPQASPAPGATPESSATPGSGAATGSEQRLQAVAAADDLVAPNSWLLESYGAPDNPQKAIESAKVTATFLPGGDGGGTVQGNAGCNGYSGPFEREGSKLKIGAPIATRKFCNPPEVMQQEEAFLAALPAASSFEIAKDRLTILYGSGQEMHFTKQQVAEARD
jgi:heat shock protein HslJ